MKIGKITLSAMFKWLFVVYSLAILAGTPARAYADEVKAPAAIAGKYVNDPTISVPAGAYTTFSTVYDGKRYYLGIDTTRAKAVPAKDTIAWYDEPNYATMWVIGGLYNPRATSSTDVLPDKNYQRAIESLWIRERCSRKKYLALGNAPTGVTYNPLILRDSTTSTPNGNVAIWYTQKDSREQNKYIQGFLYYYSDASGVDFYRYLTYNPLYGFSRAYSVRPEASQRISVWDRKTGNDITCTMTPSGYTFGLNTTRDTVPLTITSQVYYYTGVDRFRSRYDQVDVLVNTPTVIYDQELLARVPTGKPGDEERDAEAIYQMFGFYEWASNPRPTLPTTPAELAGQSYNGHSLLPVYVDDHWYDSTVVWVSDTKYKRIDNLWYDTIFAIGKSPFDRPGECRVLRKVDDDTPPVEGAYTPHTDWLRQHFYVKNGSGDYEHFVDSVLIIRRTFHNAPFVTLSTSATPNDYVFPYSETEGANTTHTFTIAAKYVSGNNILYANNSTAQTVIGEERTLDLTSRSCYKDTIWTGTEESPVIDYIIYYDTLLVEALLLDGTSAIGAGENQWIKSVSLPAKNQIKVDVKPTSEEIINNRIAQIKYTYRYRHSSAEGDWSESSRSIWLTQRGYASTSAEVYAFNHKEVDGSSTDNLQATHEKKQTFYAIPGQDLQLLLHRDHWGYYRWFIYDGENKDKDLIYDGTWSWVLGNLPKNTNTPAQDFMVINHTDDASSRGRWDMMTDATNPSNPIFATPHFTAGTATPIPLIDYDNTNKSGKVACDVSAYYDIAATGTVGTDLSAMTEPTLSYRQIIDIHPAKEQADTLQKYRGTGSSASWMETHTVVVPAGRPFSLIQRYPVIDGSNDVVQRDHLQYIYYFNPTGTDDANMGHKSAGRATDLDVTDAASFGRVGEKRYTGSAIRRAKLLTKADLDTIGTRGPSTINVLVVSANKNHGYVLGKNPGSSVETATFGEMGGKTDTAALRSYLENTYLNATIGGVPGQVQPAYKLSLTRSGTKIRLTHAESPRGLYWFYDGWAVERRVRWITGTGGITGTNEIEYSKPSAAGSIITNSAPALLKFHMQYSGAGTHKGYLTCFEKYTEWWTDYYRQALIVPTGEGAAYSGADAADQFWLVYQIIEPDLQEHEEVPVWEKYNTSTSIWDPVAVEGTDNSNYRMLDDGNLRVSATTHTAENETILYRLRTEHFQLAKFVVVTRAKAKVGPMPTTSAIIPEDSIQNHYDILFTLGNEYFEAPGTAAEVKAYNHHLPWSYTELSYHYPRSVIEDEKRVFKTDLPAAGEYAYLNKFELNGHTTSAMAGAANGYMLCIHAARKPTTIFNFTYPKLPCTDQQIYLTFYLSNPYHVTGYNPQITAELQGKKDGVWSTLHRFKTGEVEYIGDDQWQQYVLEIPRVSVMNKDSFRCVANLSGTTMDNGYVLIDGLRFIAKERPMTVFQNKATCLTTETEGDVHLTARIDYKNLTSLPSNKVAFQYQKKVGASFVPLQTNAEASPAAGDIDAYINDVSGSSLLDNTGKSCGVLQLPAADHTPVSDSVKTIDHVTDQKKCYVNEGTDKKKYYVMYLSQQVHAHVGDTFRVVMTNISNISDPIVFGEDCAMQRIIPIDNPIEIHVNGAASVWPNKRRDELDPAGTPDADTKLRPANATYSVTAEIADKFLPSGALAGSGKCMFDVVRTAETDRGMTADAWFKERFGVTRQQFREIMTIFREDEPDNLVKTETNWNNVRPEHFMHGGRSEAQADSIYRILNHLIVDLGYLEIGVSSYDIYMANNNNSYAVLWPIPGSGTYVDATTSKTEPITVCSTPRWFEIHSGASTYSLRFGYDNLQEGNYYMTPVIRATETEANNGLKVRIADITHAEHAGVVIGWDSTYVIDSNDPEWLAGGESFRYHQNRIVQDNIFDEYYKVPTIGTDEEKEADAHRYVTFRPVTSAYIDTLRMTNCPCYDYDASKTTYDTDGTTGVLSQASASGCNKWGVKYIAKDGATRTGTAEHAMPGYQTANTMDLKAGYWYKFKTSFFDVSGPVYHDEGGDGTCRGTTEFILAIAPDKVQWTPSHPDGANYWNDDNNWTPIMASAPADGFKAKVPMGGTQVIIPELATSNTLPIVNNTVPRRIDTLDYGFKKNTCKDILFKPRATMLGQEQLDYQRAFIDVAMATAEYMTFSPALKYIYAGDIYIPKVADNVDFDPKEFKDPSTSYSSTYNRKTPYAVYTAYYNQTVDWAYYNTDTEGNDLSYKKRSSADWVFTNTMKMPLTPGTACLLLAYDKTGENKDSVIVRLPKKETSYPYISNTGTVGASETMPDKPDFESLSNNLAYNKTDLTAARTKAGSATAGMKYTLTNEKPSKIFFFGNPTMALIDVYKLCQDNSSKLQKGGTETSYRFTAYQLREGEASYNTRVVTGPGQFYIAPQRSVGLIANAENAGVELEIELRPEALVAMADGGAISIDTIPVSASAPARRMAYQEPASINWLYMSAANETDGGLCKAYMTIGQSAEASRGYVEGEDALNLSSGTSNGVAYETPLSMYTIAGNEALMLDIRDSIGSIPLVFATLTGYEYEEYTLLSFALDGHWSTPLYLYDALTNSSVQIFNGLQVAVQTPQSDQIRYFINGGKAATSGEEQHDIPTGVEEVNDQSSINNDQSVTAIYDILGRKIMTLSEYDLISNIQLPTGVYIIQRGNNTERMVIR